jgi:uncharacterized protein (UPF0335 family)
MSKKKTTNNEQTVATSESIERFATEIASYSQRLMSVVAEMRSNGFPSIDRSSKRTQAILKAIGQYTRGLEGALERMQDDIDTSTATQLRVADGSEPYESVSKKTDKK